MAAAKSGGSDILRWMPRRLKVVEDDLFFVARVEAHARRLGLEVERIRASELEQLSPDPNSVLVLQLTLHPDRQLALLERLRRRVPSQVVVAVSGHLETTLRRHAKALGAVLASNSAMGRTLSRVCGQPGD